MSEIAPALRFPGFYESWTQHKFETIFQCYTNNSLSRADLSDEVSPIQNIHYGDIHTKLPRNLDIGKIALPFVRNESIKKTLRQPHLEAGDLLFADASEDLEDVGKTIEIVAPGKTPTVAGLHTIHARPSIGFSFSKGFLGCLFASPAMRKQIQNEAQGTKVLAISKERLSKLVVSFPTKEEQQKIADAFSAVDDKVNSLREEEAALVRFKAGLMKKLFSQELRFQQDNGEDFPDWKELRIGDFCKSQSGGTPSRTIMDYYNGDTQWASITDMTVCGKYIHTTKESITDKGIKNSSARVFPQNTVLLAMYGSVGKVAIAKSPMATSQAILGIQPNSAICGYEFLYYALCAMNNVFLTLGQGGVQSNLNKGLIEDQYMPLPSLEEQDKIVKALSAMDDKIAAVNKELTLMETFKKGLLQQMFV